MLASIFVKQAPQSNSSSGESTRTRSRSASILMNTRGAAADVLPVWVVLAALTTLPYVVAALRTPQAAIFSGVLTAYDDTFTYLAWMRQGAEGRLLMCDRFTTDPDGCEFFLPLWYCLGLLSSFSGIPIVATFHIARLIAGLALLLVARSVARSVMKSRTRIKFTLWLYAMSGGLGWLVYLLNNKSNLFAARITRGSADLDLPEAIAFRSVFAQVHFSVGAAMVCGAILLAFVALRRRQSYKAIIAGGIVSLLAVVHPYMVVVVCAVVMAAILSGRWLNVDEGSARAQGLFLARVAAGFSASSLPGMIYLIYLNRTNNISREWLRVTDTLSPAPVEYALGFGIVGALSVIGFRLLWGRYDPAGRQLLIWAVIQSALLYAPLSFQRRLIEGLQLPLSIAASIAVFWLAKKLWRNRLSDNRRLLLLVAIIIFASLTNLGFIAGQSIARGQASGSQDARRYVPADLAAAFDWLGANAKSGEVVFSSYLTGNLAPSMSGLSVYLGHYGMTLKSAEKGERVRAFYTGELADETARAIFAEHRVSYVIYGPFEKEISPHFVAPPWLALAHRTRDVVIYKVSH